MCVCVYMCMCVCVLVCVRVCMCVYVCVCVFKRVKTSCCRLLKIIGLFFKRALQKRIYSTKETYDSWQVIRQLAPCLLLLCRFCVCVYLYMCACVLVCVFACVYVCVCACVCVNACITAIFANCRVNVCGCACVCMCAFEYVCVYVCIFKKNPTTGWLCLVGSFKLKDSFAKEPYKRDYILQKRPINLRSLLIVATPYQDMSENNAAKNRQVSFAEYRLFCRSLLQKRPMILGSLLIVATPYPDMSENNAAKNRYNSAAQRLLTHHTHTHRGAHTQRHPYIYVHTSTYTYGAATISRLLKIIGLFCKRAL